MSFECTVLDELLVAARHRVMVCALICTDTVVSFQDIPAFQKLVNVSENNLFIRNRAKSTFPHCSHRTERCSLCKVEEVEDEELLSMYGLCRIGKVSGD
jgi:hypothetical protein